MSFFSNRRQSQPESQRIEHPKISSAPVTLTQQPIGFESVLGVNSKVEGYLESHANIRLDGEFSGTLKITGNVLVGERATINADINGKNISIAGTVKGNVSGKKVQLLRTARVWGDITATALSTEEGAFIDGKISMTSIEETHPPEETIIDASEVEETTEPMVEASEPATESPEDTISSEELITMDYEPISSTEEEVDEEDEEKS